MTQAKHRTVHWMNRNSASISTMIVAMFALFMADATQCRSAVPPSTPPVNTVTQNTSHSPYADFESPRTWTLRSGRTVTGRLWKVVTAVNDTDNMRTVVELRYGNHGSGIPYVQFDQSDGEYMLGHITTRLSPGDALALEYFRRVSHLAPQKVKRWTSVNGTTITASVVCVSINLVIFCLGDGDWTYVQREHLLPSDRRPLPEVTEDDLVNIVGIGLKCIGNDSPFLCLDCGREFKVDSEKPRTTCPKCKSTVIRDICDLKRQECPFCKKGVFGIDPEFQAIS